ncbi:alkaline phosphatase family protein [Chitinophaga arvensicola]|uniref:Metalloenzyme domain-containing protein n=1 Tax=Chitinophaga arvensicola TaxID=29529 RepID=A0A1I0RTP7_9BACT|nr:hypothetical protein [Chitinophaga arvensicola]SEW44685.1 hypothetical protein SAMN04488122_3365 [Chitinophaga arvensicola]
MKNIWCAILLLSSSLAGFAQQHQTKNILLISIDGYRWKEVFEGADSALIYNRKYRDQDSSSLFKKYWAATPEQRREKLMPFFWNTIASKGQLYGNRNLGNEVNLRNKYWFSYPGRSETLCGYYDSTINSNDYPDNPNETILDFLGKQKGFNNKIVTIAGWNAVSRIVNRNRNHLPLINPMEKVSGPKLTEAQELANEIQDYLPAYFGHSVRFDVATYAIAKTYMKANNPRVTHIDFVDPDDFGHAGQYDSYLDAGHYLDAMIGSLWNMIQNDPFYKDQTTIFIYPDHSRGNGNQWTDHGANAAGSGDTWLAVIGPDTPATGEIKSAGTIYQDQIAQTAASLLGLHFTANHPVGAPIPGIKKTTK